MKYIAVNDLQRLGATCVAKRTSLSENLIALSSIDLLSPIELAPAAWVFCSDRLPNTCGDYLVRRIVHEGEASYEITTACYFDGQDTWHNDNRVNHGRPYLTDVIKWLELKDGD